MAEPGGNKMLVNVGYGNVVNMNKVISIVRADAAPIKRMIQNAKDAGLAVDATCGRKTKCILVMDSGHLVLSALLPETIESRVKTPMDYEKHNEEMEE
ncbi:MAG TPA: hypothetical protein DIV56_06380 [Lachnospiraceae bacterium]|jgi:regulator of extracellular matrix RemA (YlzA/DUF370 family)|nr:DUF370 domain-containing protein [Roseburia sp. AM59-24XD]HCS15336.1 hypothetical protein [Lachnospiraceae bacterium]